MNDLTLLEERCGDWSAWTQAPEFWLSKPESARPFIGSLKQAAVRTIGRSAGGREIIAIEYGEKEPLETTSDCLASSLASNIVPPDPTAIFPASFYGKQRRGKPVVAFQGAIHGTELTGTVGTLNLCQIIETGKDLRGKAWPRLQELSRAARLVIIPWMNPDGAERVPLAHFAGAPVEMTALFTSGILKNGEPLKYPVHKNLFPLPLKDVAFLGSYFNDAGVNLQYDFCMPERQPETVAWMKYYLAERPDGIVIWHCNAGSMLGNPDYYLPEGFQHEFSRLAGAVRSRLQREGFELGRLSWAGLPGLGRPVLDQITATYHVCGAMPVMAELPDGAGHAPFTCEQLLDIALFTIEEILIYAHHDGLRPYELWEKVKKGLGKSAPKK